jgi:hypothetical protein
VAAGQSVKLSYSGLPSNRFGAVSGPADKDHLNTKPAGYLSLDPGNGDFLFIGPSSFQYTAGSGGNPVGARY